MPPSNGQQPLGDSQLALSLLGLTCLKDDGQEEPRTEGREEMGGRQRTDEAARIGGALCEWSPSLPSLTELSSEFVQRLQGTDARASVALVKLALRLAAASLTEKPSALQETSVGCQPRVSEKLSDSFSEVALAEASRKKRGQSPRTGATEVAMRVSGSEWATSAKARRASGSDKVAAALVS